MSDRKKWLIAFVAKCLGIYLAVAAGEGAIETFAVLWHPRTVILGLAPVLTYIYGTLGESIPDAPDGGGS